MQTATTFRKPSLTPPSKKVSPQVPILMGSTRIDLPSELEKGTRHADSGAWPSPPAAQSPGLDPATTSRTSWNLGSET